MEDIMSNLQNKVASPLYQQLYDAIMEKITVGEYQVGSQIPSEDQLSQIYKVSRITVRSAIQKLCDDNVLVKKHGIRRVLYSIFIVIQHKIDKNKCLE